MADKRAKLAELADRKRCEAEEAAGRAAEPAAPPPAAAAAAAAPAPAQRAVIDFGEDSDDEEEGEVPGAAAAAAAPDAAAAAAARAAAAAAEEASDEDVDAAGAPTADDLAFIDDAGVAADQRVAFDAASDAAALAADEAEEAEEAEEDELDRMFSKRRRGGEGDDAAGGASTRAAVEALLAQMEVAVEEDLAAYAAGRPAVHKLKLLAHVEAAAAVRRLHGELLDAGLLGVLKAWVEPMPDGELPNARVRSSVLALLGRLPVDCSFEDRRAQLKRSGLGRVVAFLARLPDETPDNRRAARELVERWSRPILAPRGDRAAADAEEEARILAARQARARGARGARVGGGDADGGEGGGGGAAAPLAPGQPGYRLRAEVPAAAPLDFVRRPASKAAMAEKRPGGARAGGEHRLAKKLKAGPARGGQRAAHVSIEGRDVTFRDA
jgi:transcription factor SPN1